MNVYCRIIEILVIIVFPLLVLYLRSNWTRKVIYINVTILPLVWYLIYAPIHELSHLLGCLVIGAEITDYRLFTHFWEGSFGFAFVDIVGGYGVNIRSLIILISPYILDFLSIILGYYILTKYELKNSFLWGLIFLILCLRPIYDLIDNYIGIYFNHSDFVLIKEILGELITFGFGLVATCVGVITALLLLSKFKDYPPLEE